MQPTLQEKQNFAKERYHDACAE